MMAAGAVALLSADVAFAPPNRPGGPERRHDGGRRVMARTLISTFRRELALAAEEAGEWLPRISNRYPY